MADATTRHRKWTTDAILEAVLQVSHSLETKNTMPTFKQIKEYYGDCALATAIHKNHLSAKQIADELGLTLQTRQQLTKWDMDSILDGVREVSKSLYPENTMPTFKQIEDFYGNCSLTSAISRRNIASTDIAKILNLKIQYSETVIGQYYEQVVGGILHNKGYIVEYTSATFPYDLFVNHCLKIEVKTSHIFTSKNGSFFTFAIHKPFITSDVYILCCVHDEANVVYYIVPSVVIPYNTQISIGMENSKYNTFINRFDIIDEYIKMYSNIIDKYHFDESNR